MICISLLFVVVLLFFFLLLLFLFLFELLSRHTPGLQSTKGRDEISSWKHLLYHALRVIKLRVCRSLAKH